MTLSFPDAGLQLGGGTRRDATNDAGEFPVIPDLLTVDCGNHVARLDACLGCRPVFLGISYQCAFRLLQTQAVSDILSYRLNLNPDPTAADASVVLELSDHGLDRRGGDRKGDADAAAGWRIDRRVHANDLALHIERWATRIALVNGSVDLKEIVIRTASDIATAGE